MPIQIQSTIPFQNDYKKIVTSNRYQLLYIDLTWCKIQLYMPENYAWQICFYKQITNARQNTITKQGRFKIKELFSIT
jgi:hypothetical protein